MCLWGDTYLGVEEVEEMMRKLSAKHFAKAFVVAKECFDAKGHEKLDDDR